MVAVARRQLSDSIGSLSKSIDTLTSKLTKVDSLAKKSGEDFEKFGKSGKAAGESASKGIQKVADVLGEARTIGKDAMSGIVGSLAALSSGGVKGALEGVVDTVAGLSQALDLLVPGLGQAASAMVKFAGSGIGLLYDLAKRTVDENQKVTELRNAFDALGSRFNETGDSMLEHFSDLASQLPQTREQLAAMAEPLIEAGIQGNKLVQSLEAQSAAQAMLGERGGRAYATLAQRARDAQHNFQPLTLTMADLYKTGLNDADMAKKLGISVDQFATQMRFGAFNSKRFGEALDAAIIEKGEKAQKSLANLASTSLAKIASNVGQLFQYGEKDSREGLDKFGKSLSDFGTIFDESTESGKQLHTLIHDLIDNVLGGSGNILNQARRGFKEMSIVFTEVYIKSHPLRRAIHSLSKALNSTHKSGISLQSMLKGIGFAASVAVSGITDLVKITTKLVSLSNTLSESKTGSAAVHGIASSAIGAINPVMGAMHLLGHAQGGVVTGVHNGLATVQAAPGEGLASIGQGEKIVPAGETSHTAMTNVFHIAISGASSSGEALELTEEALALVFERARLKAGFG